MTGEPLNVGMGGLLMGFASLVGLLEAKRLIEPGEFAGILDGKADTMRPELAAEIKALADALKGRAPPTLTAIEGGKGDNDEPGAA